MSADKSQVVVRRADLSKAQPPRWAWRHRLVLGSLNLLLGWEGVMALSKDPKKRSKQLANLKPPTPAPKGHKRRMTHGAKAQPDATRLAAIEEEIRGALPVRDPHGHAPTHDLAAVKLLGIALARLETVTAYVNEHGVFFSGGRLRPAAEHEQKLIERAANLLDRLGMTPTSRVKLGLDLVRAEDLAQAMSAAPEMTRTRRRPDDIEGTARDD